MLSTALSQLLGCFGISFIVFAGVTVIVPFLPTSPQGSVLSATFLGATFAAYPLATAVVSPFIPRLMQALGTRAAAAIGLCACAVSSFMMAFTPYLPQVMFCPALLLSRAISGIGAGMAETSAFAVAATSEDLSDHVGLVLSSMDVMYGLGAGVGASVSGVVFEMVQAEAGPAVAFMAPCLLAAAGFLIFVPVVFFAFPAEVEEEVEEEARAAMDFNRVAVTGSENNTVFLRSCLMKGSVVAGAGAIEALFPILGPHLSQPPYVMAESDVGLAISLISIANMLASMPVGALVDHTNRRGGHILITLGWLGTAFCYALLGPLQQLLPNVGLSAVQALWVTLILLGIANAATQAPSQPEMLASCTSNAQRAKTCADWNGLFHGAAIGPLVTPFAVLSASFDSCAGWIAGISLVMATSLSGKEFPWSVRRAAVEP
jgi:MFS family permease